MYVYYEHHKDANNKIVLTELRLSSYKYGRLKIDFKSSPLEELIFKACVQVLKFPAQQYYMYDPPTYMWSYMGQFDVSSSYGEEVIKKLEAVVNVMGGDFKAIAVEDLAAQAVNNWVELSPNKKKKMSAEEFFYNHGTPASTPALTKEQVQEKFRALTGAVFMDKKSYRQAASRFHPDVIGGDAAKMSEINMLWQLWMSFEKETVLMSS